MASLALAFNILAKDNASKTLDKVGDSADKMGKKVDRSSKQAAKSGGGFSGALSKIGGSLPVVGAAVAGAAVGVFKLGGAFINTSSRLEALGAKSQTVFGDQLGTVKKWADANAGAMKLTRSEAVGLTTNMADLLIPMGFTRKAAAAMSTETVGLAGALSKWSGGQVTSAGAAEILTDAMLGETDGLKALGISISAAEIDAQLLAKGQDKLTGSARAQAEAQATQALVFAKSKDAQAGFAAGGKTLADRMESLRTKLREVWETMVLRLTPAAEKFADWVTTKGVAALQRFGGWLKANKDRLIAMGVSALDGTATVARALGSLVASAATAFAALLRGAANVAGAFGNKGLAKSLRGAADSVETIGTGAKRGLDKAADSADKVKEALNRIPSKKSVTINFGVTGTDRLRDAALAARFSGDGPGRGGKALSRASALIARLGGGLRVTSTYRSPAANRAVGGSPTSYHLDRANPAVDVAGSQSAMSRFAAAARSMGGWRELLWQVPGHYDHVHVAHSGGTVSSSWPRMPGDRADERTARLQVGEVVVPKGASTSPTVQVFIDGKEITSAVVRVLDSAADGLVYGRTV